MIALLIPLVAATCIVSCGSEAPQPAVESSPPAVAAADSLEIREWTVPWPNTRPRDPIVDAQGRIWFVGQRGNYVGSLDPESGEFERTDLPPNALPHNVIVGPDGALWYAGNGDSHIGRMDPATGESRRFDVPVRDPHTLQFAPDGMLWFTAQGANRIGRLDPETGDVQVVEPSVADARPYGIVMDEEGRPWIALFGTNRIATVDPSTMELTEHALPNAETRIRRLETASDGSVWYADYARGTIGRLDPATGEAVEWTTPGGSGSQPIRHDDGRPGAGVVRRDRLRAQPADRVRSDDQRVLRRHAGPERRRYGAPYGVPRADRIAVVRDGREHDRACARRLMKRGAGGALAVALAAAAPLAAAAGFLTPYPDAPPPGTTGGFGEPTCVSCHFATTPDSLGSLALRGLPATFEAGRTYELTVELARADMAAAGFQLSARFASGPARGRQAGDFRILGDHAAVTAQSGVDYVHQTLAGAVPSTPGLARWGIEWTAPGKGSASVRFHIAANAANGDESPLGDRVYALEETVRPAP